MDVGSADAEDTPNTKASEYQDRSTLCLPSFDGEDIVHGGDDGFTHVLKQYFPAAESNATERLIALKAKLKTAETFDFWQILMEEMCDIFSAQCGYVAKRILVDVQNGPVEMPPLGEPGSCLMGTAFYLNSNQVVKKLYRDYQYAAHGTPCAHMKHDKVFIIPERMSEIITDNPNSSTLPWDQSEAFIGVPLSINGRCFAHFGMIWSTEGAAKINVSWNYIEMFLHGLEDMILERIVGGRGFVKDAPDPDAVKIIPLAAIAPSQSLKPYARNLSHELRTPMQGVVGMLDIMYSTVLDAIATQTSEQVRSVFKDLKSHIEIVQESSKRAVDAADNVVHAYDLNMQMPDAPLTPEDTSFNVVSIQQAPFQATKAQDRDVDMLSPKRAFPAEDSHLEGPPSKKYLAVKEADTFRIFHSDMTVDDGAVSPMSCSGDVSMGLVAENELPSPALLSTSLHPSHQRIITRDFLRSLLNDTLRSNRPTRMVRTKTTLGEELEVQTQGSRDELQRRLIHWQVDADVPEVIITDPQPLEFSLQKILDNAIKFTESGRISIRVRLGRNDDKVEFWVTDTGCGIDEESKQRLFKPHFQQDASISRARDGLGLSLFNAKASVRKSLGGDVTLERSATEGPSKGSEFLIRLPMSASESGNDAPMVGTPPPSSHSSHRHFFADTKTSPRTMAKSPLLECTPDGRSSNEQVASRLTIPLSRSSTRKRMAVNKQLAHDYPLNILIAEDNAVNRKVALGSLSKLGYDHANITVAFDGTEAVERYKESLDRPASEQFDVILMDIWMPKMDGYEATTKIKEVAQSLGRKITTIAVTADITSDSRERAKAVGMEGFLAKPYKVIDFEKLIIEHFAKVELKA